MRRKAKERLEELRPDAIRYYDYLLNQREYPSAGLGAANSVMDRVDGRPAETVRVIESSEQELADLRERQQAYAEAAVKRRK